MTCKNIVYTLAGNPYTCGDLVESAVIRCAEYPACTFSLHGTVTGRIKQPKPEMQDLNHKEPLGKPMVDADYSDIEKKVMAHYSPVVYVLMNYLNSYWGMRTPKNQYDLVEFQVYDDQEIALEHAKEWVGDDYDRNTMGDTISIDHKERKSVITPREVLKL